MSGPGIAPAAVTRAWPASRLQRRLWIAAQAAAADAYVVTAAFRLHGPLQRESLAAALAALQERHEMLRAGLRETGHGLCVETVAAGPPPFVAWEGIAEAECRERLAAEARRGFDLARPPLWRACLGRLGPDDHLLALQVHHVVADAWSLEIMLADLVALYRAHADGGPSGLAPAGPARGEAAAPAESRFWSETLAGIEPVALAGPRATAPLATPAGRVERSCHADAVAALHAMADEAGVPWFVALVALVKTLLYRHAGQTDLTLAAPVSVRRPDQENEVGLFIRLLPLRDRIDPAQGFATLLAAVARTFQDALAHRDEIPDDLEGAAWNVMVALQNAPAAQRLPSGWRVGRVALDEPIAKCDLLFEFVPQEDSLLLVLTYARERIEDWAAAAMAARLARLLEAVVAAPRQPLDELAILSRRERRQLAAWNETARPYERDLSLWELFARQAAARREAPALAFAGATMSYGELRRRAEAFAGRLAPLGVGRETPVVVAVERSADLIVALLGVLRAGGAYVPVDAGEPVARLRRMAEESGARAVVAAAADRERMAALGLPVLCVDAAEGGAPPPPCGADGASLACIMYTSGSTGRPKGVCVPQRAVARLVRNPDYVELGPEQVLLLFAPVSFDASTFEIWGALLNGGVLAIAPAGATPAELGGLIRRHGVTVLWLTAGLFHLAVEHYLDDLRGVRQLLSGGEVLSPPHVERALRELGGCRVLNAYGPTENTTFTSCHALQPGATMSGPIPIGKPIANTQVWVLDAARRLQPIGVAGELYLGGDGLARGYAAQPEATAERFVEVPGLGRLYRSGDLGRWRADGAIEFLGRADAQIKLRGFRIEPGEVEAALRELEGVEEAAVAPQGEGELRRLVAYVAARAQPGAEAAWRERLRQRLPEYMVPARVIALPRLPLTPNGKLDRARLPPADLAPESSGEAPRTPAEELLAAIWSHTLRRPAPARDDNFFESGGNSLVAVQALIRMREAFGADLGLRLIFDHPVLSDLAAAIARRHGGAAEAAIPPLPPGAPIPLSFAQQRLWFLNRMGAEAAGATYTIAAGLWLDSLPDEARLRGALTRLTARQASLRMNFFENGGAPEVRLRPPYDPLTVEDPPPGTDAEAWVERRAAAHAGRGFDLERDPLLRLVLIRLGDGRGALLFSLHHIVGDGWSLALLVEELGALYRGAELPPPAIQYGDYAAWQRERLGGDRLERLLAYWRARLEGAPELLALPADHARPAVKTFRGGQVDWALEAATVARLRELGLSQGATLYMTLLAALQVLLARWSGERDIVLGSPVGHRERPETGNLIGLFVNTVALRTQVNGDEPFAALLRRVRAIVLEAWAHQELPFEKLVEVLEPERSLSRSPIFQAMLTLQNEPIPAMDLGGIRTRLIATRPDTAKFDLLVQGGETADGGLAGVVEYSRDLFEEETAHRLAGHFVALLRGVAATPQLPVDELPIMPAAERSRLLAWNDTARPYEREAGLWALFARQAEARPAAIAVEWGAGRIAYGELRRRAERLGARLSRLGVGAETPVMVAVERSAWLVVALLGVVCAGGAYVPVDAHDPPARLRHMAEECGARIVLTLETDRERVAGLGLETVGVDVADAAADAAAEPAAAGGASLAYIMYTSGSTGRPKGILIPQRAVARLVRNNDYCPIAPRHRVAQLSTAAFDAATFEIWGALLNGATLCVERREDVLDAGRFLARLRAGRWDVAFLTTALFNRYAQMDAPAFAGLECLLFGGENADPRTVRAVLERGAPRRLLHVYGPTECTTFATWHRVEAVPADAATVPIGQAIANTAAWVLDAQRRLQPIGVAGELYLGGDGLARGYLGRPESTAERFVTVPELGRLYRTGDLVRRRSDGALEFIGRADAQVKLRGFRIEPGEIEAALRERDGVRDAAVVVQGEGERRRLVAYVTGPEGAGAESALREHLRQRLPEYMVPARIVTLAALPLTANGKLDRARLPQPEAAAEEEETEPPATELERRLAAIWSRVLRVENVGRRQNFFALGGDSILCIQLVAQARQAGLHFQVRDVLQFQTLAELAPCVREAAPRRAAPPVVAGAEVPLTPIQRWFFARDLPEPWHFNQAVLLRPLRPVAPAALRAVLDSIAARHAAFRLRFARRGGEWIQFYGPVEGSLPLVHEAGDAAQLPLRLDRWQRSLRLEEGPLARVALFDLGAEQRLFWTAHHLAIDAVSWRTLLAELEAGLIAAERGEAFDPPLPEAGFDEYARALAAWAGSPACAEEHRFFSAAPLPLPLDRDGAPTLESTRQVALTLDPPATRALLEAGGAAAGLRAQDLLLTAAAQALADWTGRDEVSVDLEGHGRVAPGADLDLSQTVGWFTSLYPLRIPLAGAAEPDALARRVSALLRAVPNNGLAFGALPAAPPRADGSVMFNYLGQLDQALAGSLLAFAPEPPGETHSRRGRRAHQLTVEAMVWQDRLQIHLGYSEAQFHAATIERLGESLLARLRGLLGRAAARAAADFPLVRLEPAAWDELNRVHAGNIETILPLTPMQQALLLDSEPGADGGTPYFEQLSFRLEGAVAPAALRAAWEALLRRHAILRAAALLDASPPAWLVLREAALPWREEDWRAQPPDATAALREFLERDRRRGFDPGRAPLLRVHLARLPADAWQMTVSFHHALLDGWSLPLLFADWSRLLADAGASLPPVAPFQRYVEWLCRQDVERARAYWAAALEGFTAPTPLPGAAGGGAAPAGHGEIHWEGPADLARRLREFALARHLTVNTLLEAAWGLILSRYTGHDDVVFGVTVSGRDADVPGIEAMVGLFINTLPRRVRVAPDAAALPWLRELQREQHEAAAFAWCPLAEIRRAAGCDEATRLFDALFVFENYPAPAPGGDRGTAGAVAVTAMEFNDRTGFPLVVAVALGDTLRVRIGFDRAQYGEAGARRLAQGLLACLAGLIEAEAGTRLGDLPCLTADEIAALRAWSAPREVAPRSTLAALFDPAQRAHRRRVAIACGAGRVTYAQLDGYANALARRLLDLGAGPGRVVALRLGHSWQLVAAMLGIVKTGAAYLPIDPETPAARQAFLLADAGAALLVSEPGAAAPAGVRVLAVQREQAPPPPCPAPRPEDAAYVIYTSGSTGEPKGVPITHANAARLFTVTAPRFRFGPRDVWTLFHSAAFDFSVWEIWGALLHGGRLVVVPREVARDPYAFFELLRRERVTVLNQTPSAFRQLIPVAARGPRLPLRLVIFGGEALEPPALAPWFAAYGDECPQLVNMYGITETTVHVTWRDLKREDTARNASPIGAPLPDLGVALLDDRRMPVPRGAPGEIHVSGAGVAPGYLNRPELTAARFPRLEVFGERRVYYRSGDLGRWNEAGELEYLGRGDDQVKVRGHRVEMGEIEAVLSRHPAVAECVVLNTATAARAELAAFLAGAELSPAALREWLAARLPAYMLPARLMVLPRLPLTGNGKIDRRALRQLAETALPAPAAAAPPTDELESAIQRIWQEVLGRPCPDAASPLFALGGNSLHAMQIAVRVGESLGARPSIARFLEDPTIAGLARIVRARIAPAAPGRDADLAPAAPQPHYPLSHEQMQLWLEQQAAPEGALNMTDLLEFQRRLDLGALQRALAALCRRHEILRTSFPLVAGEPRQAIARRLAAPAARLELPPGAAPGVALAAEAARGFDLTRAPLFRLAVLERADGAASLLLTMHHMLGDAWTIHRLLCDLGALYEAELAGRPARLPAPPLQYKDYAVWQSKLDLAPQRDYWRRQLQGAPPAIALPRGAAGPAQAAPGGVAAAALDAETSRALRGLALRLGGTLADVGLACFAMLLFDLSRQSDLCIAMALTHRPHRRLEQTAGPFVNLLPIRLGLSDDLEFEALLRAVRARVNEAMEHAAYPYHWLARDLAAAGNAAARPFLDAVYVFQNAGRAAGVPLPPASAPQPPPADAPAPRFARYPLCLSVTDDDAGLRWSLYYDARRFSARAAASYLDFLGDTARSLAAAPAAEGQ